MKIYLIIFNDGSHRAFSSYEKMKEFILRNIHNFCETMPNDFKSLWGSEEELISEFLRDNGIEELFYTMEVLLDDTTPVIFF